MGVAPVRLVVLNDFPVVSAGVAAMLEPYADRVRIVAATIVREASVPAADVILYDVYGTVAEEEGRFFETFAADHAKLVVYSWAPSLAQVDHAIRAGAAGCLSKRLGPDALVDAIERIAAGEVVVPDRASCDDDDHDPHDVAAGRHGAWPGVEEGFSARESEVIALIARGLSNQEIADRCYLSINSVKTYVRNAYRKMGVSSRSQAVLWALEHDVSIER